MAEPQDRSILAGRLREAVARSRRGRLSRGITAPWRAAYLRFLRVTGRAREVQARTFFGTSMTVTLPEHVSIPIWLYGFLGEDVCLLLLAALPAGGRFIDVGAHVGFFTLLGAHVTGKEGRVLALEPTPSVYKMLQKNVATNPNIVAHPFAAYSEDGELILHDYGVEFSAYNSLMGIRLPEGRRPMGKVDLPVRARKIDDLLAEERWDRVDVVKIDAESSEGHVLRGTERTILGFRPAVIVEVGDYGVEGSLESREIIAWFDERGYAAFEEHGGIIVPHRSRERYEYANVLFIPQERVARFAAMTEAIAAGFGGRAQ